MKQVVHVVALCFIGLRILDLDVNGILQGAFSILFAIRMSNLSLLSDVFGTGVNRNEFGHNECFTQTMFFPLYSLRFVVMGTIKIYRY